MNRLVLGQGAASRSDWGLPKDARVLLVSEPTAYQLFGARVLEGLRRRHEASVYLLPAGEKAKSWGELQKLLSALLAAKIGRDGALVALGGGAVTDAAGFAAAIYLRGIPWVSVPTTILGQLDSGLGGKTAVNLPEGKNLAGAFWQPARVVCDTDFLKTLPARERVSGLAEAVKIGLTFDPGLYRDIRKNWDALLSGEAEPTARVIKKAAAWKLKIVARDERETRGVRDLLNFGHTLGHALEKAAGLGRLKHGEAVIWGMRAAVRLSVAHAGLALPKAAEFEDFLAGIELPKVAVKPSAVLAAAAADKKARRGRLRFILLRDVGRPLIKEGISSADIVRALDSL